MDPHDDATRKLSQYFTAAELASLTAEEVRLLTLLDGEELPSVPEEISLAARAEYQARIHTDLRRKRQAPD